MAIVIKKIISEIDDKKFWVKAKHNGKTLQVYVIDQRNCINTYLDKEITFEMEYESILNWKIIDKFNQEDSGLFCNGDNTIVRGMIHNFIETDNDIIIDIYIMNGADFLAILSSEIEHYIPKGKEGIELVVKNLCIYPVHY